jgi:hypothetical protein
VQVVSALRGRSCGSTTSLDVTVRNTCGNAIAVQICIRRSNGTCDCFLNSSLAGGGQMSSYSCNTANLYGVEAHATQDFARGCFGGRC